MKHMPTFDSFLNEVADETSKGQFELAYPGT